MSEIPNSGEQPHINYNFAVIMGGAFIGSAQHVSTNLAHLAWHIHSDNNRRPQPSPDVVHMTSRLQLDPHVSGATFWAKHAGSMTLRAVHLETDDHIFSLTEQSPTDFELGFDTTVQQLDVAKNGLEYAYTYVTGMARSFWQLAHS